MLKVQRLVSLILAVLFLTLLPAGSCQVTPVVPTPAPAQGGVAQGGSTYWTEAGGESSAGGDVATGGMTTTTTQTDTKIVWPACNTKANKAAPADIEQFRRSLMPARPKALTKHTKASYLQVDGLPDRFWTPLGPALDQGGLGACTGNAMVLSRVSKPWTWSGTLDPVELEKLAVSIYADATKRDPFPGTYPPDDTGSDGNSVMSVAKERGLISGWTSVYTFAGLQRQLQKGPCILGSNWYTSMFYPNSCGQLDIWGNVEGGHETTIRGIRYDTKQVLLETSWGNKFGVSVNGRGGLFWLTFGSVERLLNEGADIECPYISGGT